MSRPTDEVRVTLELAADDDALETIASRIPEAATLAPGTRVVVLGARAARGGFLARLRPPPGVPASLRASALLVRGYVDIMAHADQVSGEVPDGASVASD